MDVGNITASLSLNIGRFVEGFDKAKKAMSQFGNNLGKNIQKSNNNIDKMNRKLGQSEKQFKQLDRIVSGILVSQAFYRAVQGIESATRSVLVFNNQMERAQIAMEYFLGTPERAKGFIITMKDFAATTAFSTQQALELSKRLLGAGFAARTIRPLITTLNDAASATGTTASEMNRIVLAMTQVKAAGRLMGQEIRQFYNANIPIYQILQEQLGLTRDQMANIGELNIDGETAVAAIIKGFQERYSGAADRVAQTLGGMWDTIRDDALIVSEDLFEAPYEALKDVTRKFRNFMEGARHSLTESGLGGLLEDFVPEDLQDSIRAIAASFLKLVSSLKRFAKAMAPILGGTLGVLIKLLGNTLPILTAAVGGMLDMASAALEASPALKVLVGAITFLTVANTAAVALAFLWRVMRVGVIASAVAQAVLKLVKAIQLLALVLVKSRIALVLTVVAGTMLYLASTSKAAAEWIDNLTGSISSLVGMDLDGILQPTDGKSVDEWTSQFNEQLDAMNEGMKNVGLNAALAGKKVNDKFVASFDELYQVPEKLDDINNGFELPSLDGFPNSGLELLGPTLPPDGDASNMEEPWWTKYLYPPAKVNKKPPDGDGKGAPDVDTKPATNKLTALSKKVEEIKKKLLESMGTLDGAFIRAGETIASWEVGAVNAVGNFATSTGETVSGWTTKVSELIKGATDEASNSVSNFSAGSEGALSTWSNNSIEGATEWSTDFNGIIADWADNTGLNFYTWKTDTESTVGEWSDNTQTQVSNWSLLTGNAFTLWQGATVLAVSIMAANTSSKLKDWSLATVGTIGSWAVDTTVKFKNWVTNTDTNIKNWASNTGGYFSDWASVTSSNIATWGTNTSINVANWITNTSEQLRNWASNTGGNLATWVNNTTTNFGLWSLDTNEAITGWVNGTASNIANWVTNTSGNIATWGNAVQESFNSWASGSWSAVDSFLSGTASNITSWANSTISSIVDWASAAWSTIKDLAGAVGKEVGGWFSGAKDKIGNAYHSAGDWVGKHKEALAAAGVAALIIGTGAATIATGGAAAPALAAALVAAPVIMSSVDAIPDSAAKYARGGIVDREQVAHIAERNRREAIIPMENSDYMAPFSAAVANDLMDMLEGSQQQQDTRPILYIGTLIADDKGLKELERKLEVIRLSEDQRKGLPAIG